MVANLYSAPNPQDQVHEDRCNGMITLYTERYTRSAFLYRYNKDPQHSVHGLASPAFSVLEVEDSRRTPKVLHTHAAAQEEQLCAHVASSTRAETSVARRDGAPAISTMQS
jgi:hypothetical protein